MHYQSIVAPKTWIADVVVSVGGGIRGYAAPVTLDTSILRANPTIEPNEDSG